MSVARLRPTIHHRVGELEKRADKHDTMADQVHEMYEVFKTVKTINWFVVKVAAVAGGGLGFVAVVLTIIGNAAKLAGH
jgi:hypothetical protein